VVCRECIVYELGLRFIRLLQRRMHVHSQNSVHRLSIEHLMIDPTHLANGISHWYFTDFSRNSKECNDSHDYSIISLRVRDVVLSSSPIYGGLDLRKEAMMRMYIYLIFSLWEIHICCCWSLAFLLIKSLQTLPLSYTSLFWAIRAVTGWACYNFMTQSCFKWSNII